MISTQSLLRTKYSKDDKIATSVQIKLYTVKPMMVEEHEVEILWVLGQHVPTINYIILCAYFFFSLT